MLPSLGTSRSIHLNTPLQQCGVAAPQIGARPAGSMPQCNPPIGLPTLGGAGLQYWRRAGPCGEGRQKQRGGPGAAAAAAAAAAAPAVVAAAPGSQALVALASLYAIPLFGMVRT